MAKAQIGAVPGSKNIYLDALSWGGNRWDQSTGPITYAFDSTNKGGGYLPWQAADKAAFRTAFQLFSNVANVTFKETATPATSNFQFFKVDPSFPGSDGLLGAQLGPIGESEDGDGYYNAGIHPDWSGQLGQGGYSFLTIIHELGHGLGLAHPHDDGGGSPLFPGVDGYDSRGLPLMTDEGELDLSADTGDHGLNSGLFTMMSYNDLTQPFSPGMAAPFGFSGTPMAFDIAVLQRLYGANTTFRTGNDTYALPGADKTGTFWSCLWDAGGTDTISSAGSNRACTIDLRAAPLTGDHAGGYVSSVEGVHGGFTIAHGVTIERAVGGGGNDLLIGNAADNRLDGGAGDDVLWGGRGNDLYRVDSANDRVVEVRGQGHDTIETTASYALGTGQEIEILRLVDATHHLGLTGNGFSNTLIGNGGNNVLRGGLGNDILTGGAGRDTFVFHTAPGTGNADRITDFSHADDGIRLMKDVFGELAVGGLSADAFKIVGVPGAKVDADDRILYDPRSGILAYDADGSGAGGRTVFATLTNKPIIDHTDFFVV